MASPRQTDPTPNGGQVWPFPRPDPPESRLRGQRPVEPLVCPSSPAQSLQLIHGDRQVGDRRQAPRGWRAEQRLLDRRRRSGAAGEEQAAAMRGLRAQFHGGARPPGAPAPSSSAAPPRPAPPPLAWAASPAAGACGSNTNTTPRFRDAAVAGEAARTGGCLDPAGASHTQGCFPLTPRGQRAGGRRQPED